MCRKIFHHCSIAPPEHRTKRKISIWILWAYATLFNANSQLPGVNLIDFHLHGIDNYATVDWELVALTNPVLRDTGNYGISLSPGTEYSVVIPFDLFQQYFGADTWRDLDSYQFYLCRCTPDGEIDVRCQPSA